MANKAYMSFAEANLVLLKLALDKAAGELYWLRTEERVGQDSFSLDLTSVSSEQDEAFVVYNPGEGAEAGHLIVRFAADTRREFVSRVSDWLYSIPRIGRLILQAMVVETEQGNLFLCRNHAEFHALLAYQKLGGYTLHDWTGSQSYPFLAVVDRDECTVRSLVLGPILELIKE